MLKTKEVAKPEEYMSVGAHIGTRFKNRFSKPFIVQERTDKIKLIDVKKTDEKIRVLISLLLQYEPKDFVFFGKSEHTKKALNHIKELIGCDVFTGRYLPGKITNIELEDFKDYKVVVVCDPRANKNILNDAFEMGIVTVGFCNTNSSQAKLDLVIPINDKGTKSLPFALYLILKNYLIERKIMSEKEFKLKPQDFYID